jgi:hypothetical protein
LLLRTFSESYTPPKTFLSILSQLLPVSSEDPYFTVFVSDASLSILSQLLPRLASGGLLSRERLTFNSFSVAS